MSHCHSCGGVIGRDCWNPQECAEITERMAIEQSQPDPATSNANTSGLEVVAWMYGYTHDQTRQLTLFEGQATDKTGWHQPLVTAASAQARIDAAEARADRLAKALRKSREGWANALELGLLPPQHEETAADLRDEADEALQQETQK